MVNFPALLNAFIKLLIIVNPITMTAIFISYTRGMTEKDRKATARKTCLSVLVILILCAWLGTSIFNFFGINLYSLEIVGGLSLLLSCLKSLGGGTSIQDQVKNDISIVPLSIPIIAGPAAISVVIKSTAAGDNLFMTRAFSETVVCIIITLILGAFLGRSTSITKFLGETTINVISCVSYLILACIAVDLMASGMSGMNAMMFT